MYIYVLQLIKFSTSTITKKNSILKHKILLHDLIFKVIIF